MDYMYFSFNGECTIKWKNGTFTKEHVSISTFAAKSKMQAIMKVKKYMEHKYVYNNYIDLRDTVKYIWVPEEGLKREAQNIRYELDLIDLARKNKKRN